MTIGKLIAGATASVVALASVAVAGLAGAETTARQAVTVHDSGSSVIAALEKELAANENYPYTQLSISFPKFAIKDITAQDAAIVSGLSFHVETGTATALAKSAVEFDVYYKSAELGSVRYIAGNLYFYLDSSNWSALPLPKSEASSLSEVDLEFGERWLELPASALSKFTKGLSKYTKGTTAKASSTTTKQYEAAAFGAFPQLLTGIALTEGSASGGNKTFKASGTIAQLGKNAVAFEQSLDKSLGQKFTAPTLSKPSSGTVSLTMTTVDGGAFLGDFDLSIVEAGEGAFGLQLDVAHAVLPVVAPAGAKPLPPSILSSL